MAESGASRDSARPATLPAVSTPRSESALKRVARRLVRPLFSPIDGRVADINSRVEYVQATDQSSLEAYARGASEASAYIGVELRRINEQLTIGESFV